MADYPWAPADAAARGNLPEESLQSSTPQKIYRLATYNFRYTSMIRTLSPNGTFFSYQPSSDAAKITDVYVTGTFDNWTLSQRMIKDPAEYTWSCAVEFRVQVGHDGTPVEGIHYAFYIINGYESNWATDLASENPTKDIKLQNKVFYCNYISPKHLIFRPDSKNFTSLWYPYTFVYEESPGDIGPIVVEGSFDGWAREHQLTSFVTPGGRKWETTILVEKPGPPLGHQKQLYRFKDLGAVSNLVNRKKYLWKSPVNDEIYNIFSLDDIKDPGWATTSGASTEIPRSLEPSHKPVHGFGYYRFTFYNRERTTTDTKGPSQIQVAVKVISGQWSRQFPLEPVEQHKNWFSSVLHIARPPETSKTVTYSYLVNDEPQILAISHLGTNLAYPGNYCSIRAADIASIASQVPPFELRYCIFKTECKDKHEEAELRVVCHGFDGFITMEKKFQPLLISPTWSASLWLPVPPPGQQLWYRFRYCVKTWRGRLELKYDIKPESAAFMSAEGFKFACLTREAMLSNRGYAEILTIKKSRLAASKPQTTTKGSLSAVDTSEKTEGTSIRVTVIDENPKDETSTTMALSNQSSGTYIFSWPADPSVTYVFVNGSWDNWSNKVVLTKCKDGGWKKKHKINTVANGQEILYRYSVNGQSTCNEFEPWKQYEGWGQYNYINPDELLSDEQANWVYIDDPEDELSISARESNGNLGAPHQQDEIPDIVSYTFTFKPPHPSNEIIVTGSFDDWGRANRLKRSETNGEVVWQARIEIKPTDNIIQYKYIVDGEWTTDSTAPRETDRFGNTVNILRPQDLEQDTKEWTYTFTYEGEWDPPLTNVKVEIIIDQEEKGNRVIEVDLQPHDIYLWLTKTSFRTSTECQRVYYRFLENESRNPYLASDFFPREMRSDGGHWNVLTYEVAMTQDRSQTLPRRSGYYHFWWPASNNVKDVRVIGMKGSALGDQPVRLKQYTNGDWGTSMKLSLASERLHFKYLIDGYPEISGSETYGRKMTKIGQSYTNTLEWRHLNYAKTEYQKTVGKWAVRPFTYMSKGDRALQSVFVIGSWDDWSVALRLDPHSDSRTLWRKEIYFPVCREYTRYSFIVDGVWMPEADNTWPPGTNCFDIFGEVCGFWHLNRLELVDRMISSPIVESLPVVEPNRNDTGYAIFQWPGPADSVQVSYHTEPASLGLPELGGQDLSTTIPLASTIWRDGSRSFYLRQLITRDKKTAYVYRVDGQIMVNDQEPRAKIVTSNGDIVFNKVRPEHLLPYHPEGSGDYTFRWPANTGAQDVYVTGDWSFWKNMIRLEQNDDGSFSVVSHVAKRETLYQYIVDGKRMLNKRERIPLTNRYQRGFNLLLPEDIRTESVSSDVDKEGSRVAGYYETEQAPLSKVRINFQLSERAKAGRGM